MRLSTDERLVTLVRRGESAAFEAVYERHLGELLAFCVYMLGSRHDAEDAVQATFISAYKVLRADTRQITLRPWLFTIARNECISALRARRPTAELNGEPAPGADPLGKVELREEVREMLVSLRALPERQRAALVLAELHGLSQSEIAAVLGVRPTQVKAYVYQARSNLVSERRARDVDCRKIREELALARGAALLKGALRRHVRSCAGCRKYADGVAKQRQYLGALLPLTPSLVLRYRALEEALGVGNADPTTYVGGAALAGSAAVGGSLAGAAAEVAGGGIKALALKFAAGIAALGATVGVGASVIGTTPPLPGSGAVVATTASDSLPLAVSASASTGGLGNGVQAQPSGGAPGTAEGGRTGDGSASARRQRSLGAAGAHRYRTPTVRQAPASARTEGLPPSGGIRAGSEPGEPSEGHEPAAHAHPSNGDGAPRHEPGQPSDGSHAARTEAERMRTKAERESQRSESRELRKREHEEQQRSRSHPPPKTEEERLLLRKEREERRREQTEEPVNEEMESVAPLERE
jgi:RNA polymerase sigma factor (sigma-70 family)